MFLALSNNFNVSGKHLECIKSWFIGPPVVHTSLPASYCTHRIHSGWLILIDWDSRCFLALSNNFNASGKHLDCIESWLIGPPVIDSCLHTMKCSHRNHSCWLKLIDNFTHEPWLEWHLYCIQGRFSGPQAIHTGLHTVNSARKKNLCWITLIHCNSKRFETSKTL